MASVKKNIIYNVSYRVFQILIPLIVTPYLSRVLHADGVGLFSYYNAAASYFVLFVMLGISSHGVRTIAAVRVNDSRSISMSFWSLYAGQLIAASFVVPAYLIYSISIAPNMQAALIWLPYVLSAVFDCSWFIFGCGEYRIPVIRNYFIQITSTICTFVFVRQSSDVLIYMLITSLASLLSVICLFPYVVNRVSCCKPSWDTVKKELKSSLLLFAPVVAISIYTSIDKLMLGTVSGMAQYGYYTYSDKIISVPTAVLTASGTVLLPKMSELYAANKYKEANDLLSFSMWIMQAFSWGIFFGTLVVAQELVPVFLGNTFTPCVPALLILSSRVPVVAFTYVLGNQYLLPNHFDTHYTYSVFVGAGIDIGLNLFLLQRFGAVGAALSTLAAEISILVVQFVFTKTKLPLVAYCKDAAIFALCSFLAFVGTHIIVGICQILFSNLIVQLMFEATCFVVLYGLFSFTASYFVNRIMLERFVSVLHPFTQKHLG